MTETIDVRRHLTVEDLRQINLNQWHLGHRSYFGSTPHWTRPEREVLAGIAAPTHDVQVILDALPPYPATESGVRRCWAHHMALHAGCHPWPNANHRTAHRGFNFALDRLRGLFVGFPDANTGHELIAASHRLRDGGGGEYLLDELSEAGHPYRRLFETYSGKLLLVPTSASAAVAAFGEM